MLAPYDPQANNSPFTLGAGLVHQPTAHRQPQETIEREIPETNKGRTFRRAANACEIAAGASLNSAVVFFFHLCQVHPAGLILSVGAAHFYFTATAMGEEGRESVNAMTGCAASLAIFCSLHQPIGEWLESRESIKQTQITIQEIYPKPQPSFLEQHGLWVGISAFIGLIFVIKIIKD